MPVFVRISPPRERNILSKRASWGIMSIFEKKRSYDLGVSGKKSVAKMGTVEFPGVLTYEKGGDLWRRRESPHWNGSTC